jgi:hypothetical protein
VKEPIQIRIKSSLSLLVSLLAVCLLVNACRTPSTRVTGGTPLSRPADTDTNIVAEIQTNTIVLCNQTRYLIRLSRNGVPWTYQARIRDDHMYDFQREVNSGRTLVLSNCTSSIHERIVLGLTAVRSEMMGCLHFETPVSNRCLPLDLGINDPATVLILRSTDFK